MLWTIPLTRSGFSSSITTRRVWPEVTQRRSAVSTRLGGVDRDHRRDRRHHLARLLLVQVEDAAEHARLAGVERAALAGAVDDLLQVLGGVVLFEVLRVDAEEADDRVGERRSAPYIDRRA